jgi:hypothetical protein
MPEDAVASTTPPPRPAPAADAPGSPTRTPVADAPGLPPAAPRFSWPLRIFLSVLLFDMLFRCFAVLYPWTDWRDEMNMTGLPRRFPTPAERAELAQKATPDNPHPVADRVLESFDSLWDFFRPWPDESVRRRLRTPSDGGKFVVCWINTRLNCLENIVGIQQGWVMFSPSVHTGRTVTRARLRYADGTERIERHLGDPDDLTRYFRWNKYRVRSHQMEVQPDRKDECFGYCNLLSHRHARNEKGSALTRIRLFQVRFEFPPPGADAHAFLQEQMRLTHDSIPSADGPVGADFYEFDAEKRVGTLLKP